MRRWPPATSTAPTRSRSTCTCRASTASACCARCKAGKAEPVPVVVVSAFSPAHGARAVDALAEGAFDLVAKPAMGESMATFTEELSKKVSDAAIGGKLRRRRIARARRSRRPGRSGRAAPGRPRPQRHRARWS